MWKVVQVCFNEYCPRVLVLVVHAGPLGVLIGEYDKPGYKLRKRAHIGGPELRTKKQEPRTKKQEARTKKQAPTNKNQEICVCHCFPNQEIRPWQAWVGNEARMLDRR